MGFPQTVNTQPAPGVEGDFASTNPRSSVLAGPGGLVAGPSGLIVGRFAWITYQTTDANDAPATANNSGAGKPAGFVHRLQQGLITTYLAEASLSIPAGFGVTVMNTGDFWAVNSGSAYAQVGMKAFANYADGKMTFAAAGSTGATASGSASSIAAGATTFTGSIADNVLTASAVTGLIVPGETLSGSGIASGTKVVSQLSGTPLGAGTYVVSIPGQTVASTAVTGSYGLLTVGGTVAGSFGIGDVLSGTGVDAGTRITALGTGVGGAGTYYVDSATVVGSTAITAGLQIETDWFCRSPGAQGELVKISSYANG